MCFLGIFSAAWPEFTAPPSIIRALGAVREVILAIVPGM
jgi:hypothetical protein